MNPYLHKLKATFVTLLFIFGAGCVSRQIKQVSAYEFEAELSPKVTNSAHWSTMLGVSRDRAYLERGQPPPGLIGSMFLGAERQVWWAPLDEFSVDKQELLKRGILSSQK